MLSFILNISSTTNSITTPPPPQCHKVYNHGISTNITRSKRPFALKKNDPPLHQRTTLPESHPKKTDLTVGAGPSKRRKHVPIGDPKDFGLRAGRKGGGANASDPIKKPRWYAEKAVELEEVECRRGVGGRGRVVGGSRSPEQQFMGEAGELVCGSVESRVRSQALDRPSRP